MSDVIISSIFKDTNLYDKNEKRHLKKYQRILIEAIAEYCKYIDQNEIIKALEIMIDLVTILRSSKELICFDPAFSHYDIIQKTLSLFRKLESHNISLFLNHFLEFASTLCCTKEFCPYFALSSFLSFLYEVYLNNLYPSEIHDRILKFLKIQAINLRSIVDVLPYEIFYPPLHDSKALKKYHPSFVLSLIKGVLQQQVSIEIFQKIENLTSSVIQYSIKSDPKFHSLYFPKILDCICSLVNQQRNQMTEMIVQNQKGYLDALDFCFSFLTLKPNKILISTLDILIAIISPDYSIPLVCKCLLTQIINNPNFPLEIKVLALQVIGLQVTFYPGTFNVDEILSFTSLIFSNFENLKYEHKLTITSIMPEFFLHFGEQIFANFNDELLNFILDSFDVTVNDQFNCSIITLSQIFNSGWTGVNDFINNFNEKGGFDLLEEIARLNDEISSPLAIELLSKFVPKI